MTRHQDINHKILHHVLPLDSLIYVVIWVFYLQSVNLMIMNHAELNSLLETKHAAVKFHLL